MNNQELSFCPIYIFVYPYVVASWKNSENNAFFATGSYESKRVFTWDPKWNLPEIKFGLATK